MKRLAFFITVLFYVTNMSGQDEIKSGIIYGNNHAFGLTAPEGWVLDNHSGVNQGLHAVFYRKGQTWQNATTVMYANTASLEDRAHKTIDQLITYDLKKFQKEYSDLQISDGVDIIVNDKVIAKIKYLSGKSYGNFEAIAYIDAVKTGVMIIMSSRTKEDFETSLNAFETLVKSYIFIADKVVIEKKQ